MIERMRKDRLQQLAGRSLFNKVWRAVGMFVTAFSAIMLLALAMMADNESVATGYLAARLIQYVAFFAVGITMARKDYFYR